jgi:hypothetical protein
MTLKLPIKKGGQKQQLEVKRNHDIARILATNLESFPEPVDRDIGFDVLHRRHDSFIRRIRPRAISREHTSSLLGQGIL